MNHGGEFPWHKMYFVKWTLAVIGLPTAVQPLQLKLVKAQWLTWLAMLKRIAKHLKQNNTWFSEMKELAGSFFSFIILSRMIIIIKRFSRNISREIMTRNFSIRWRFSLLFLYSTYPKKKKWWPISGFYDTFPIILCGWNRR